MDKEVLMASIQKRGSTYRARVIRSGYPTHSKTFNTRTEAIKWARSIETSIDNGTLLKKEAKSEALITKNTSFKTVAEHYIKSHTVHKRNYKSETFIINALTKHWGETSIYKISVPEVLFIRDDLLARKRSGATINKYFNAISKIFQMVQNEWEVQINNPIKNIKRLPASPHRTKRITGTVETVLLESAKETCPELLVFILELAIETGMRRSELMGLEWTDVDLSNRRIFLNRTKNGESRQIPLTKKAVAVLNKIPKEDPDRVFNVSLCWLRRSFDKARSAAKKNWRLPGTNPFDDIKYHDLRHEALSRLSDAGLNVIELSYISGHKTLAMLKVYVKPSHQAIFTKLDKTTTLE